MRIDLKLAEPERSCQQTMKYRVLEEWFSEMVNRNLSHFCKIDNLVYMLLRFSLLRLIHVIVVDERLSQGQWGLRHFRISIQLASLDLG